MDKGDIKIKRRKQSKDYVTFDPRISIDRKTFVLRVESSCKATWYEYLVAIQSYADEEIDRIGKVESDTDH